MHMVATEGDYMEVDTQEDSELAQRYWPPTVTRGSP